jgi:hypothetical protein
MLMLPRFFERVARESTCLVLSTGCLVPVREESSKLQAIRRVVHYLVVYCYVLSMG